MSLRVIMGDARRVLDRVSLRTGEEPTPYLPSSSTGLTRGVHT